MLTLGFDEKFCFRAILRHRVEDGDRVVLITASLVDRVKKAYEQIKAFLTASYKNINLELMQIDVNDLLGSVEKISKKLEELSKCEKIIVNVSGGMRILAIIVLLTLIIKPMRNLELEIELEDSSALISIPADFLKIASIKARLSKEKIKLLKLVVRGENDVKSLARHLEKDESTIRRHISDLEELKLIEIVKRKPLKVKATKLARLVL